MDKNLNYTLNLKDFFRKTMLGAQQQTKMMDQSMGKLQTTINRVGASLAGVFAISKIKDFAVGVVMATAAMTSFQNSVIASSRSDGEGRSNISFLNNQVDRLGLNLHAAQAGYKTLSGSVMGTNIQGAKSNKIFRQVSEASAVLGLSAEQTEGSFLALGQMISKGTVQAEELRGQLAERIPGAFQIGARAMGMTTLQLGNAMKDGLIKSDEFLVKFGNELEKTFGGKLENATISVQSNINRMENEWERLQVNIGNSQIGIINNTLSWSGSMLKSFNSVIGGINQLDAVFKANGAMATSYFEQQTFAFAKSMGMEHKSKLGQLQDVQKMVQTFVDKGGLGEKQRILQEGGLKQFQAKFAQEYKKGTIGAEDFIRINSFISDGLASMAPKDLSGEKKSGSGTGAGQSIGSPVDISGPRAQNITVNLEKLGDVIFQNVNVSSDMDIKNVIKKAVEASRKEWMELLNDTNAIANK